MLEVTCLPSILRTVQVQNAIVKATLRIKTVTEMESICSHFTTELAEVGN